LSAAAWGPPSLTWTSTAPRTAQSFRRHRPLVDGQNAHHGPRLRSVPLVSAALCNKTHAMALLPGRSPRGGTKYEDRRPS
jgi:hypothetical protein